MSHNFVNFQPFLLIFEILYASWSILSATKWTHEDVRKTILYSIRHEICSIEHVLLWWRRCFFVLYATSKTNPLGVEYRIIPSQTPYLAWAREKIHPVFHIFATRHKQNTPILDHNTPLKAGVLPMVFVSWYIFNREDFVEKKIPSRWNFKFFMYVLQKNSILRSI